MSILTHLCGTLQPSRDRKYVIKPESSPQRQAPPITVKSEVNVRFL